MKAQQKKQTASSAAPLLNADPSEAALLPAFSASAGNLAANLASERALMANKIAQAEIAAARAWEDAATSMEAVSEALAANIARARRAGKAAKAAALDSAELARSEIVQAQALSLQSSSEAPEPLLSTSDSSFGVATRFFDVDLAATRRYGASARPSWKVGDLFELAMEPANEADPNAVMVMSGGAKVGYLARESAEEIQELAAREGWTVSGPAFLLCRSDGKFREGTLSARLESRLVGWRGYNPTHTFAQNLSAMETAILSAIPAPNARPKAKRKSL